jgi:hypothetical protein
MSNRHRITTDEHVILAILVERKPAFSFELVRQLRWHDDVMALLGGEAPRRAQQPWRLLPEQGRLRRGAYCRHAWIGEGAERSPLASLRV